MSFWHDTYAPNTSHWECTPSFPNDTENSKTNGSSRYQNPSNYDKLIEQELGEQCSPQQETGNTHSPPLTQRFIAVKKDV